MIMCDPVWLFVCFPTLFAHCGCGILIIVWWRLIKIYSGRKWVWGHKVIVLYAITGYSSANRLLYWIFILIQCNFFSLKCCQILKFSYTMLASLSLINPNPCSVKHLELNIAVFQNCYFSLVFDKIMKLVYGGWVTEDKSILDFEKMHKSSKCVWQSNRTA